MTDIIFGETSKKVIFLLEKMARRHLKASVPVVQNDMENCGNPVFKAIYKTLIAGGNHLKPKYQRRTVNELGGLGLWILYKDTAYRDVFIWIIYQLLKRAEVLLPIVEKYLKEPEEWYPNNWIDTKENTAKQVEDGKIPAYAKSQSEAIYTPSIQKKNLQKLK